MRRALFGVVALMAVCIACLAPGASASTPVYDGQPMYQSLGTSARPLVGLIDFIPQSPNYWHEQDQGFLAWHNTGTQNGQPEYVLEHSDCSNFTNRVCVIMGEDQLNNSGSVTGYNGLVCHYTGSPNLAGQTCWFGDYQNGIAVKKECVTRLDVDQHADPSNQRVQITKHELGHCFGLTHDTQGTAIMEPNEVGDFPNPTAAESDAIDKFYSGNRTAYPGCCLRQNSPQGGIPDGTPFVGQAGSSR